MMEGKPMRNNAQLLPVFFSKGKEILTDREPAPFGVGFNQLPLGGVKFQSPENARVFCLAASSAGAGTAPVLLCGRSTAGRAFLTIIKSDFIPLVRVALTLACVFHIVFFRPFINSAKRNTSQICNIIACHKNLLSLDNFLFRLYIFIRQVGLAPQPALISLTGQSRTARTLLWLQVRQTQESTVAELLKSFSYYHLLHKTVSLLSYTINIPLRNNYVNSFSQNIFTFFHISFPQQEAA